MIDKLLENSIKNLTTDNEIAVLLSGGVDSISIAFAAHRLGKKVTGYTFHLKDRPSYDSTKAVQVCDIMGWNCVDTEVPVDNLREDFFTLLNEIKCVKKTHFECCFPFLYVYPNVKEKEVVAGLGADGYYGVSKKACLHYKTPKSKFDEYRTTHYLPQNLGGKMWQTRVAEKYGKKYLTPYIDEKIRDFFFQYDWFEVNQPYQKHHVVEAFPEFKTIGKVNRHTNLQLGAGIDIAFEALLDDPIINFKNRKRIMDVCRDWNLAKKPTGNVLTFFETTV
jgi:asparagine synthetase B (glutamine-hydrolysing)